MEISVESVDRFEGREARFSLYLNREVLPASPGGLAAVAKIEDRIYTVSKLDGEDAWTIDGESLANGLPIFFNGTGARYLMTRTLPPILGAAVDAAAEKVDAKTTASERIRAARVASGG